MVSRLTQIALLIAIIVPFGLAVRAFQQSLGQSGNDIWLGVVIGFVLCFCLWKWDDKIKERAAQGKRTFGD
jgi:hypothetical protein